MLVARARCHGSPHQRERENRHPWRHGNRPRGRAPPWRAFRRAPAGGRTRTLVGGRRCGARRLRPLQGDTSFKVTPPSWRGGAAVAGRQSSGYGFLPSFSRPTKRLWPHKAMAKLGYEQKPAPRKEPSAAPRARRVHRSALTDLSGCGSLARQTDFGHTELWQNSVSRAGLLWRELLAWHPKLPLACSSSLPFAFHAVLACARRLRGARRATRGARVRSGASLVGRRAPPRAAGRALAAGGTCAARGARKAPKRRQGKTAGGQAARA